MGYVNHVFFGRFASFSRRLVLNWISFITRQHYTASTTHVLFNIGQTVPYPWTIETRRDPPPKGRHRLDRRHLLDSSARFFYHIFIFTKQGRLKRVHWIYLSPVPTYRVIFILLIIQTILYSLPVFGVVISLCYFHSLFFEFSIRLPSLSNSGKSSRLRGKCVGSWMVSCRKPSRI